MRRSLPNSESKKRTRRVAIATSILLALASLSGMAYASESEPLEVLDSPSANSIKLAGRPNPVHKAIRGTGRVTKAIGGTGLIAKAIGGTGREAKAIGGTGRVTKAIGGTGRETKAIGGTGRVTKAIGGTGRETKAIGGTGRVTKAIGGTGRATKAIGGTGRTTKAIGGTGRETKAIGGTGRVTKAIGGTGRETKAIGGTGRVTKAIGGTGRATKAIGGTRRTTKAIGGTGRVTKAIGGTGRTTKAIGGTGRVTKAIGGTGRTAKAIGGTGRSTKAIGGTGRSLKANAVSSTVAALDLPLLRGRVDFWNPATGIVEVLGQSVLVESLDEIAIGSTIVLEGSVADNGNLVATFAWIDSESVYVDGSSEVVVTGKIASVDLLAGKLKIGNLVVDYTAALSNGFSSPAVGAILTASGIRPNPSGEFIAVAAEAK